MKQHLCALLTFTACVVCYAPIVVPGGEVAIGDSTSKVITDWGHPISFVNEKSQQVLFYDRGVVTLKDGKVISIGSPQAQSGTVSRDATEKNPATQNGTAKSVYISGKVVQVLDDGILLKGSIMLESKHQERMLMQQELATLSKQMRQELSDRRASPSHDDGGNTMNRINQEMASTRRSIDQQSSIQAKMPKSFNGLFYVVGIGKNRADGEPWSGIVYYAGMRQYISVLKVKKTVRCFHVSPTFAASMRTHEARNEQEGVSESEDE